MIQQPKRFALIGAAGYVAPRHMKAIQDTGNILVSAFDPVDSVGVLDQFGYNIQFFTNQREFENTLQDVDVVSIASPNYLHRDHCRVALQAGCHVICEKPLVTDLDSIDYLSELERNSEHKIFTVLQLRLHPILLDLHQQIRSGRERYQVSLNYITPRGKWYYQSWKGNNNLSGGLVFNIGIHLLDMLIWLFGEPVGSEVYQRDTDTAAGLLHFDRADVDWLLSINPEYAIDAKSARTMFVNGQMINFSTGFTDLHTRVYQEILAGKGFGIFDVAPAIRLATEINGVELSSKSKVLLHSCTIK